MPKIANYVAYVRVAMVTWITQCARPRTSKYVIILVWPYSDPRCSRKYTIFGDTTLLVQKNLNFGSFCTKSSSSVIILLMNALCCVYLLDLERFGAALRGLTKYSIAYLRLSFKVYLSPFKLNFLISISIAGVLIDLDPIKVWLSDRVKLACSLGTPW